MVRAVYNSPLQEMIDLLEDAQNRGYSIKEFLLTQQEWLGFTDWVGSTTQEERSDVTSLHYWPAGYRFYYPADTTEYAAYLSCEPTVKVRFKDVPIRILMREGCHA